jgi:hypothetical protein
LQQLQPVQQLRSAVAETDDKVTALEGRGS